MKILMPQLGETVTEGTIVAWHRRDGDAVAADDVLFEIETDKVATEVPSPTAGVLRILVPAGETVAVGVALAEIEEQGAKASAPQDNMSTPSAAAATPAGLALNAQGENTPKARRWSSLPKRDSHGRPLSPAVRRIVREQRIDTTGIAGTGRDGRVRKRDLLTTGASVPTSHVVPFNRLRKRTAEHMVMSKARSPHVLQAIEVDFQQVAAARESAQASWRARRGQGLSFLPFLAYAVCRAIKEFPIINASVEGESLHVHPHVNLAIAVDLAFEGLLAPVIHRADALSVGELAVRLLDLTSRARNGKLNPDDMKGGTYTLSNSGTFGTLITAPIINQPQVAILSMDGIRKRPVVIESAAGDAIAIRPVGILAQSFDHRAMDGAYSAAYLAALKRTIETTDWSTALAV